MNTQSRAVFLDRDGVINIDRADFVKSWDEFEFVPHSLDALAVLSRTTYKVVVITNQSGIGRGLLTQATLDQMHARMINRIRDCGGRIDAVYFCPHAPDIGCDCRKPAPGLFFEAARDMNIDLSSSWAVGDSQRDTQAANRAGVRAILLNRTLPDHGAPAAALDFVRAADLREAVELIQNGTITKTVETVPHESEEPYR